MNLRSDFFEIFFNHVGLQLAFCFDKECENENCCHWGFVASVKCPAVNWHRLAITSNRYHHSAFIGHIITCESLTEKIKFPGTSVQWKNCDLAAQMRTAKEIKHFCGTRGANTSAGHWCAAVGPC